MFIYYRCFPLFLFILQIINIILAPVRFIVTLVHPQSYPPCQKLADNYWKNTFEYIASKTRQFFSLPLKLFQYILYIVDSSIEYFKTNQSAARKIPISKSAEGIHEFEQEYRDIKEKIQKIDDEMNLDKKRI